MVDNVNGMKLVEADLQKWIDENPTVTEQSVAQLE